MIELLRESRIKHRPYGTSRPHGTMAPITFLDALLDELKVYDRALSGTEIAASYTQPLLYEKRTLYQKQ